MQKRDFEGIVPALITPMDADGALHEDSLRAVFESNVEAGVHGFWVAGGTGESILLSDASILLSDYGHELINFLQGIRACLLLRLELCTRHIERFLQRVELGYSSASSTT